MSTNQTPKISDHKCSIHLVESQITHNYNYWFNVKYAWFKLISMHVYRYLRLALWYSFQAVAIPSVILLRQEFGGICNVGHKLNWSRCDAFSQLSLSPLFPLPLIPSFVPLSPTLSFATLLLSTSPIRNFIYAYFSLIFLLVVPALHIPVKENLEYIMMPQQ